MTPCQKCGARTDIGSSLCRECARELRANLGRIPWLSDRLAEAAIKDTAPAVVPQPPRAAPADPDEEESPVPFDPKAREMFNELRTVCMRWVRDFCDQLGVEFLPVDGVPADFIGPLPRFGGHVAGQGYVADRRDRRRIPADYVPTARDLARWLRAHHQDIVCSDDASMCAGEIENTVKRAAKRLGARRRVYCGPCPTVVGEGQRGEVLTCDQAIYAEWDDEHDRAETHATCWKCRAEHDVAELKKKIFARADNFLFTAADLFRTLDDLGEHLPRNRFYEWRKTRAIRPRGWQTPDGRITQHAVTGSRPVFELSEVRELAAKEGIRA